MSEQETSQLQLYCIKCQKRYEVVVEKVEMQNGKVGWRGKCPVCGTSMYRIVQAETKEP